MSKAGDRWRPELRRRVLATLNEETAIHPVSLLGSMAGTTGLEPATSAVTGQRSNQLSYVPNAKHK